MRRWRVASGLPRWGGMRFTMAAAGRMARSLLLASGIVAFGGGVARAAEHVVEEHVEPRWMLSFAASGAGPVPAAGVELAYRPTERLVLGTQLGTFVFHNDLSVRARYFYLSRPRWGLYAGGNAHLWYSPLLSAGVTPVGSGEVGAEMRWAGGMRAGLGVGMALFAGQCVCSHGPRDWVPLPVATIRIGKAW
jgi:hypothetical protein